MMNIKCNIIVDAWLGQILITGSCLEILVLEVIRDSCSRQRVGTVWQRVGSVHYQFKLPFIWEGI